MTKPRSISAIGLYHVVIRGNNKNDVFCDDEDNLRFLYILKELKEKDDFDLYAYCLMVNHAHLMLRTKEVELHKLMTSVMLRFVKWYNKKYERTGRLFQDRFFSNPVINRRYFLAGLQYIYNNPVKAGLCSSPWNYKWSSFRQLYMRVPGIPSITVPANQMPLKQELLDIMDSQLKLENWEPAEILYDTAAMEIVKGILEIDNWKDLQNVTSDRLLLCVDSLIKSGSNKQQIQRLLGISRYNINKILKERSTI